MKISKDNNDLTNISVTTVWLRDFWGNPIITCPPNTHWEAIFNSGTVQPGSSGSPIFDQNHRVVGQLHGNYLDDGDYDYCDDKRGHYGRFDVSWIGGGTNDTRLSNWLDPNTTQATTTNTISLSAITGPSLICSSGGTFSILDIPNTIHQWTCSDNLQINGSSTNYSVNVSPATYAAGDAWVRDAVYITGVCTTYITRNINSMIDPGNISGTYEIPLDAENNLQIASLSSCNSITSYEWFVVGYEDPIYTGGPNLVNYIFHDEEWNPGYFNVYCTVSDGTYSATTSNFQLHLIAHDPLSAYITGDEYVCLDDQGIWVANASGGDTEISGYTYEWYIENEYIDTGDPHCPYLYYYFDSNEWFQYQNYEIDLRVYDDSTYIDANTFYFQLDYCPERMDSIQLFPNPANDFIEINIIDIQTEKYSFEKENEKKSDVEYLLTISDSFGRPILQKKTSEKNIRFDTSNFKEGIYNLIIYFSKGSSSKKFIVNH